MRLCVDYRKVNHVMRKDAYPIPRVDGILDTPTGSGGRRVTLVRPIIIVVSNFFKISDVIECGGYER